MEFFGGFSLHLKCIAFFFYKKKYCFFDKHIRRGFSIVENSHKTFNRLYVEHAQLLIKRLKHTASTGKLFCLNIAG